MRSSISEQLKTAVYRRHEEDDESSAVQVTPRAVCYLHFLGLETLARLFLGLEIFFPHFFFYFFFLQLFILYIEVKIS